MTNRANTKGGPPETRRDRAGEVLANRRDDFLSAVVNPLSADDAAARHLGAQIGLTPDDISFITHWIISDGSLVDVADNSGLDSEAIIRSARKRIVRETLFRAAETIPGAPLPIADEDEVLFELTQYLRGASDSDKRFAITELNKLRMGAKGLGGGVVISIDTGVPPRKMEVVNAE